MLFFYLLSILPLLSILSLTVAAPTCTSRSTSARCTRSTACHDYVLVSTRGTDEPQGPSFASGGLVSHTLANIPGGVEYDIVYPAIYDADSPISGMSALKTYLRDSIEACPEQNYVLLGYSQGAYVTSLALQKHNQTDDPLFQAIKAVVLFGNPVHQPNRVGNVDEKGGNTTYGARGTILSPFTPSVPDSFATTGKLLDVCISGDFVCDFLSPARNVHGAYGATKTAQEIGWQHIAQQLSAPA
ncbi:hypothetical protein CF326_g7593 [Tilletia indica]|nr:hypothetical protein CF326_g7593 [Tilletia indica]